jgi:ABC-type transport system involved in multi-copper enzyme maturation permease subunit
VLTEKNQESLMVEKIINEKEKMGIERQITQIYDTILFEFKRYWKIFLLLFVVYTAVFILYYALNEIEYAQGVEIPEEPIDYITSYLGMFSFLIIISTATLEGSIIAEDFNKQTGNLLFPKIDKSRLLIGRTIARYALNVILVVFYYIFIAVVTNSIYGEVPEVLLDSLKWALLYLFMITAFVIFMSSINKSASAAMIISILFLLIVFNLIETLLMVTGIEVEPLFLPTYYYNIIKASLDMPDDRYVEILMPSAQEEDFVKFKQWITPSMTDSLYGMLSFAGIFLIGAYIIYKRRQSKNE